MSVSCVVFCVGFVWCFVDLSCFGLIRFSYDACNSVVILDVIYIVVFVYMFFIVLLVCLFAYFVLMRQFGFDTL